MNTSQTSVEEKQRLFKTETSFLDSGKSDRNGRVIESSCWNRPTGSPSEEKKDATPEQKALFVTWMKGSWSTVFNLPVNRPGSQAGLC